MSGEVSINKASKLRCLWNWVREQLRTPYVVLGLLFIAIFSYLVIMPFWEMISTTFQVQSVDVRRIAGSEAGQFTTFYWQRMLNSPLTERAFIDPLKNTLLISITYTFVSMLLGVVMAYLSVRTNMIGKGLVSDLVMIPYIIPSWGIALAWETLFRSTNIPGSPPGFLQDVLGIAVPTWFVYGPVPIIIVLSLNYFAFTYLLASAALANLDTSYEEAGQVLGSSRLRVFRRITLPMILPAMGSAFILTFSQGVGTFGVPAFLGMPDRYFVLSTYLFFNMNTNRIGDAFVLATVIVFLASITIYLNNKVIGKRRQYTAIGGKGGRRRITDLGRWRKPISYSVLGFLFVVSVLPLLLLVLQTLTWRVGDFSLNNLTTHFWFGREMVGRQFEDQMVGIFFNPSIKRAIWNSLRLGVMVGVLAAVFGQLVGYVASRGRGTRVARFVDQLAFLPFVIPSIVFGAIYLTMFAQSKGPLPALYGTFALLVLVATVKRLPYAARSGGSAMMQVGMELEEAGRVHGAGFFRIYRKILLPLTKNGLFVGFIFAFVNTIKDLGLIILLITPVTNVLPALTYTYVERGFRQYSDAVSVLIVLIVFLGTYLARKLSKTDFSGGFGGGQS